MGTQRERQGGRRGTVTVVVPVWNGYVRFLDAAVAAVRRNDPEVPILIVDNASRHPVPVIPGTWIVRSDKRLTVGEARNLGLTKVQTEYAVVLDVDDELAPGSLGYLRERLDARPDLSVCALSLLEGSEGPRHRLPRWYVPALARHRRAFALAECVWPQFSIQGCAMLRMSDVRATLGYADTDWSDDWALAASLAFRGSIEVHRRIGLYYAPTEGSIWRRPRSIRELRASTALIRSRLRADPVVAPWARRMLPLITILQLMLLYLARPPYRLVRRAGQLRRSPKASF